MSHITQLIIKNITGIEFAEINPDTLEPFIVAGKNGSGKSELLNSLLYLLTGKRSHPTALIRTGADEGSILATLDDGTTIRLKATAKGAYLSIKTADGLTAGQAWLAKKVGTLLNPLTFAEGSRPEDDRRRADLLRELSGLDLGTLDKARGVAFAARADVKRDLKREQGALDAAELHAAAPDEPVSLADLTAEMTEAQGKWERARTTTATADRAVGVASDMDSNAAALENSARLSAYDPAGLTLDSDRVKAAITADRADSEEQLKDELDAAKTAYIRRMQRIAAGEAESMRAITATDDRRKQDAADAVSAAESARADHAKAAQKALDAVGIATTANDGLPDLEVIRAAINGADAINEQVRANQRREQMRLSVQATAKKADDLSCEIQTFDDDRRAQIAAAPMPIEGIGFDAKGGVTFNGLPFAQANTATRIRVSFAIAIACNPAIRVMIIHRGESLDEDSKRAIFGMAKAAKVQLFIEVMGDEGDAIMLGGTVRT